MIARNGTDFCFIDGSFYSHGEVIVVDDETTDPCTLCRCMLGQLVCHQTKCAPVPPGCRSVERPSFCCGQIVCGTSSLLTGQGAGDRGAGAPNNSTGKFFIKLRFVWPRTTVSRLFQLLTCLFTPPLLTTNHFKRQRDKQQLRSSLWLTRMLTKLERNNGAVHCSTYIEALRSALYTCIGSHLIAHSNHSWWKKTRLCHSPRVIDVQEDCEHYKKSLPFCTAVFQDTLFFFLCSPSPKSTL